MSLHVHEEVLRLIFDIKSYVFKMAANILLIHTNPVSDNILAHIIF